MIVVVAKVLSQHYLQVLFARDQHPVGAVATHGATLRSAIAFTLGACGGVRITAHPSTDCW